LKVKCFENPIPLRCFSRRIPKFYPIHVKSGFLFRIHQGEKLAEPLAQGDGLEGGQTSRCKQAFRLDWQTYRMAADGNSRVLISGDYK